MAMQSQTRRSLLLGFIVSISLCGLVGIYCLIFGSFGRFEGRILASTATTAGVFLLGLASAMVWERGKWPLLGVLGLISAVPTLALTLAAIWLTLFPQPWEEALGICWTVAVTLPLIGLLSLARLRSQYRWIHIATIVCVTLLALQIIATILVQPRGKIEELWFRAMGILGILSACGVITVPILHRVSAIRVREAVRTVELLLSLTCPRCELTQDRPAGRSTCEQCGLRFTIEIEEENCRQCGYPLYKIESAVCPECGTQIIEGRAEPQAPGLQQSSPE